MCTLDPDSRKNNRIRSIARTTVVYFPLFTMPASGIVLADSRPGPAADTPENRMVIRIYTGEHVKFNKEMLRCRRSNSYVVSPYKYAISENPFHEISRHLLSCYKLTHSLLSRPQRNLNVFKQNPNRRSVFPTFFWF